MLALCFPVILSLALAAPGISRTCSDYCKARESEQTKDVAPRGCNCVDIFDYIIESEESSAITLDDTGVYFVPAEVGFIHDQMQTQPFFISNPAKLVQKSRNRIYREFDSSRVPVDDPLPSQSAQIEIYKKTETISQTTVDEDSGKSPLYLDLEIQESTDMDRASVQEYTFIKDFETTEKTLVKCLDFQVVHYTRKYGFMKEFQEFWKVRNLNKYEHWSDIEVEENIKSWCSEPASIVQQSLQEIKQGLPKKAPSSRFANRAKDIFNATLIGESTEQENTTSQLEIITANVTDPPETINGSTEAQIVVKHDTEIYDNTFNPLDNWVPSSTTPFSTLKKDDIDTIQNFSYPSDALPDTTTTTTDITLFKENPDEIKTTVYQSIAITVTESNNDLDTMASEDVSYKYVPASTEGETLEDVRILNNNTTSLDPEQALHTESAIKDLENNTKLNDIPVTDEPISLSYYPDIRSSYKEKEMKIPRLITKECQNNTIQTSIDGIEELPNNDFRNNESDITGRLYFISEKELVPLRFVQTDSGNISLGMDGRELCSKLIRETYNKSHLLTALCEYIQSDLYKNKKL